MDGCLRGSFGLNSSRSRSGWSGSGSRRRNRDLHGFVQMDSQVRILGFEQRLLKIQIGVVLFGGFEPNPQLVALFMGFAQRYLEVHAQCGFAGHLSALFGHFPTQIQQLLLENPMAAF